MVRKAGHVVHVVGEATATRRAGLCGSTRGKGWIGNPTHVSWLYDKFCTRCFRIWTESNEGLWAR